MAILGPKLIDLNSGTLIKGCDKSTIHNDVYEFVVIRIPKDLTKEHCEIHIHNDVYECCENIGTCTTNVYVLENGQTLDRPEHCVG